MDESSLLWKPKENEGKPWNPPSKRKETKGNQMIPKEK